MQMRFRAREMRYRGNWRNDNGQDTEPAAPEAIGFSKCGKKIQHWEDPQLAMDVFTLGPKEPWPVQVEHESAVSRKQMY